MFLEAKPNYWETYPSLHLQPMTLKRKEITAAKLEWPNSLANLQKSYSFRGPLPRYLGKTTAQTYVSDFI